MRNQQNLLRILRNGTQDKLFQNRNYDLKLEIAVHLNAP